VLLVDDHEVVRDGVRKLFDDQPGSAVFGDAAGAAAAIGLVTSQPWDIAVLDLSLGGRNGLELLSELKEIRPELPILILSMHSEEQYARRAFRAGASGYITKSSSRSELSKAIQKIVAGGRYVSPELAEKLAFDFGRAEGPPHMALSDRELEVLLLIASGKTVSEIADQLSLSDKTVSTYRARILEKMAMQNNSQLIRYAIQNKLVD
jgi:DNA-binding NarL/FixJ family response regulator